MVVGGYSKQRDQRDPKTPRRCVKDENGKCRKKKGPINDVELLNLSNAPNRCSKPVAAVVGKYYNIPKVQQLLKVCDHNSVSLPGL